MEELNGFLEMRRFSTVCSGCGILLAETYLPSGGMYSLDGVCLCSKCCPSDLLERVRDSRPKHWGWVPGPKKIKKLTKRQRKDLGIPDVVINPKGINRKTK